MLFTIALAVLSSLLAGVIPALLASRPNVGSALREGGREEGTIASTTTRTVLVTAEVALALVLLAGAGLLVRTLWTMEGFERGFSSERIATVRVSLPTGLYAGQPEVRGFFVRLLDRVRALPGVESAATGTGVLMPLLTNSGTFSIEGRPQPPPEQRVEYPVESVSPGYFETLGATLVSGRTFTAGDHPDAPLVIVINETLAQAGWPGQDPIGRRIRPGDDDSTAPWMTVVGVVRDLRRGDLRRPVRPEIYLCALQRASRTQMLLIRTASDPAAIIATVRREVQTIDPQLPLFAVTTLDDQVAQTLTSPRFRAVLLAGFAAIALALAAIGIYGVTSHAVAQRTHEVGIRMALGANRRDVLTLVLTQHLRPVLIGVGLGLTGAVVLSQFMRTLVYGVRVVDPVTLVSMSLSLLAVAVLACAVPARRATRVDPLTALRGD
jgi:predicted permease